MTGAQPIKRLLLILTAVVIAALCGGVLTQRAHLLRDLPPWVVFGTTDEQTVIRTPAGEETVTVTLHDSRLRISSGEPLFSSGNDWAVADCFVRDLDRDGYDEVMLHVWRRGSFGKHQPFWQKPDDKACPTEHLFIYEWDMQRPDRLDPVWMSSQIPVRGQQMQVDDSGVLHIEDPDGNVTLWEWGGWGLVRKDA